MSSEMQSSLTPEQVSESPREDKRTKTARSRSTSAGSGSSSSPGSNSSDIKATTPDSRTATALSPPPGLSGFEQQIGRHIILAPPGLENLGAVGAAESSSEDDAECADVSASAMTSAAAKLVLASDAVDVASPDEIHVLPTFAKSTGRFPPPPPPCQPPALGKTAKLAASRQLPPARAPVLRAQVAQALFAPPVHWPAVLGTAPVPPPPPAQPPTLEMRTESSQDVPPPQLLSTRAPLPHSPPPLLPPALGAVLPHASLAPPTQAPGLCASLPPSVAPPPVEAPVLGLQSTPSLCPPPAEAPVLCAELGAPSVTPPPMHAPVLGAEKNLPSVVPPPSHAPTLCLVDMVPTPEVGTPVRPTIGSEGHSTGNCRPCAFLYTKGCSNGAQCAYCHLCQPGEKKRRMKEHRQNLRSGKMPSPNMSE